MPDPATWAGPSDRAPRVTMLVRNAFTNDSRVEKEARSLARAGYTVTVVAEGRAGLPDREDRDGYGVRRVHRGAARVPGLRMRQYRTRLMAAVQATDPEVLHAHDSDALEVVGQVASQRGIPFVYDAHELWLGQENRGRSTVYFALFRAWYRWLQRRWVPRAAAVLSVSEPIVSELERQYAVRVALVPNYPEWDGAVSAFDLRGLLEPMVPPDGPIVLYLGSTQVGRGLEELISALPEVPGASVVILGATQAADALLEQAAALEVVDRLRIVPPVAPDEVVGYAAAATIGVALTMPISLNNRLALSNKLFQYMAAGIPVVANDVAHVRAIVEGSGAGICVDPTDPKAIATALRQLIANPVAAAEMGRRGAAAIRDRYNWAQSERALLEVYERIRDRATGGGR